MGRGGRDDEVGGAGGLSRRGWGIWGHIQPEPRVFYVCDGKAVDCWAQARGGQMNRRGSVFHRHPPLLPPASQLFSGHLLPFSSRNIRSLSSHPLLHSTSRSVGAGYSCNERLNRELVQSVNFKKQLANAEAPITYEAESRPKCHTTPQIEIQRCRVDLSR